MIRHLLLTCLLPIILVASANSEDDFNFTASANDFLRLCEAKENQATVMTGACTGYVQGVIDGFDAAFIFGQTARHEPPKGFFCTPPESTMGQKYRVVVKFMKDHPEKDHLPVNGIVVEAIVKAFPCPQAKTAEVPPPNK